MRMCPIADPSLTVQHLISSPSVCCRWWVRSINSHPTLTLTWSQMTGRWPQPAARPAVSGVWERPSGWTSSMQMCCRTAGSSAATWRRPAPLPVGLANSWGICEQSWDAGPSPPRRRPPPRPQPLPPSTPRWMVGCPSPMGPVSSRRIRPARRPAAPRTATRLPVPPAQERESASVTKFCTTHCAATTTKRRSKRNCRRTRVAAQHRTVTLNRTPWRAQCHPNARPLSTRSSTTVWTLPMSRRQWRGQRELTHYPGKVS